MAADAPRPDHPRPRLPARGRQRCWPAAARSRLDRLDLGREPPKTARRRRRATSRAPKGSSLRRGARSGRRPSELVVSPAALVFYKGENRYPFGVFEQDRTQVADAEVALYFAKVPEGQPGSREIEGAQGSRRAGPQIKALEEPAIGPFPASIESLATQPAFRAQTTSDDPDAATVVYSTDVDFPSDGEWRIAARDQGRRQARRATLLPSAIVGEFKRIPRVGQKAPLIHTPTAGGRRRRPLEDHDADPAGHPEQGRLRRRARQGTDRPLVCDPPVLPESGLRPGRRRGRAGQTAIRRQGGLHPHGDLQRQRPEQGRATAGAGLPPADASRGCSRSTATARSAT